MDDKKSGTSGRAERNKQKRGQWDPTGSAVPDWSEGGKGILILVWEKDVDETARPRSTTERGNRPVTVQPY
jgi:hypothetical protein